MHAKNQDSILGNHSRDEQRWLYLSGALVDDDDDILRILDRSELMILVSGKFLPIGSVIMNQCAGRGGFGINATKTELMLQGFSNTICRLTKVGTFL